ncbi:hypothetical protein KY330_03335 [Candidatus Woesearchaeota archaeon]|nr:hypothetical protein [Candidatus Woesearchaeota archaeon]
MKKKGVIIFVMCFLFSAAGVGALSFSVSKTVLGSGYHLGETIEFRINITNTGSDNITLVHINDTWDNSYVQFAGSSVPNITGGSNSAYWENVTNTSGDYIIEPNEVFSLYVNMTAINISSGINNSALINVSNETNHFNLLLASVVFDIIDDEAPYFTGDIPPYSTGVEYATQFTFIVNATDAIAFDTYSVNDTSNFEINDTGFITNKTLLSLGAHVVNITINDTSGNENYTILTVTVTDSTVPVVSLTNPTDGQSITNTNDTTFSVSATDPGTVANCTLWTNMSGSWASNGTNSSLSGTTATWSVYGLSNGAYLWNAHCCDPSGNCAWNATNFTFSVAYSPPVPDNTAPTVSLTYPDDSYFTNSASVTLNCSATENVNLANVTLYLNLGSWHANETDGSPTNATDSTFSKTMPEGTYIWNCRACDNSSNCAYASANKTFTYDATKPTLSSVSSGDPSDTAATITWTTDESANSTMNYGTSTALGTIATATSFVTSHSVALSSLSAETTYYYNVTSCDQAGNCNTTGPNSFTTDAASTTTSSTSSSRSSAPTIFQGKLTADAPLKFSILEGGAYGFNHKGYYHRLQLMKIIDKVAEFTIQSDSQTFRVAEGESEKLDIDEDDVYDIDFYVVEIQGQSVRVEMNAISEEIVIDLGTDIEEVAEEEAEIIPSEDIEPSEVPSVTEKVEEVVEKKTNTAAIIIAVLTLIIVVAVVVMLKKPKSNK